MMEPMLNPKLPVPLYHQLKEIFDAKIANGEWKPGQLIPTENELIAQYKVSRTTVREAVTALVNEGKLEKKQGKGTLVCNPKLVERLGRLTGFTEEMIAKGFVPGAKVLEVGEIDPPPVVRERLLSGKEEKVLHIQRIRLANEEPIAIERTYWPLEIGRWFLQEDLENIAFYSVLEQHGIQLRDADEGISSTAASKKDAQLLNIKERDPLLRMERITYALNGMPIEYTFTDYRSDRYTYRVHLHR
ncbi:HTH-type transcriptional repressor yvoA [Chlamydia abortus]|uniref:GntR family transcriptional regulator n=1 Tax=Paenibacillus residui TaxID=629724 RepID=A0ABW3DGN7_9BACL|nr:HTH-type transcriptional repressor yvoA [Chlamydia abortus]